MRLLLVAACILSAAPALGQSGAQPNHLVASGRSACVVEESGSAFQELTRHDRAGAGQDAAVRFSVTLPASWEATFQDTARLVLSAVNGDNSIWVTGNDLLPEPLNRADTLNFWMTATELLLDRDVTRKEVEDFRESNHDRIPAARAWITRSRVLASFNPRTERS